MQPGAGAGPYRRRLRVDPTFFLELQHCHEAGIAHSTFLAWAPADRAKALAFVLEKATRCVLCGTAEWEWNPALGGDRRAYEPTEKYCHGCYLKTIAGEDTAANPGITVELAPTGTPAAARRFLAAKSAHDSRHAGAP